MSKGTMDEPREQRTTTGRTYDDLEWPWRKQPPPRIPGYADELWTFLVDTDAKPTDQRRALKLMAETAAREFSFWANVCFGKADPPKRKPGRPRKKGVR